MTASPRPIDPAPAPPSRAAWNFDAVIFDMDGVVTDTASVHARAWQRMFDEYLARRAGPPGTAFPAFSPGDYRSFVDGKPRYEGVDSFLRSRGIRLPWGAPDDPADRETVCGLGNRKNVLFNEVIAAEGVRLYASTLDLIHALRRAGFRVGLATSSRNAARVLTGTPAAGLFGVVVDGLVAEQLKLNGKPRPDIFMMASASLGVAPARAVVVEDAVSGVQAGAAGGFGLVLGVARGGDGRELRENGADLVVRDLAEISIEELERRFCAKQEGVR